MEEFFKLRERGTSVKVETMAGVTTFMTMAYILAVNPNVLGKAGMDQGAVFTATALASAIASFCMALFANLPFVLSAGMGLNAYFAYSVVLGMGYTWQQALTAVFVEGLVFVVLSLTNVREAIFNAIPNTLKVAVSVGIGLFICFIGLQNSKIVVDGATLVTLFSFKGSIADGTFNSAGVSVILALCGILLMTYLLFKNVKGSILIGMVVLWVVGMILQAVGIYVPNPEAGYYSLFPSGCASKANMLDEKGELKGIKGALLADSIGTIVGAVLGTSTITTFVESSSGISEGGRTGLTSIVSGLLFLVALFFSPVFLAIPSFATAPALIVVGFLMLQQVTKIDWNSDLLEAVPAYICIFAMPFMYSISEGIAFGVISYVVLNLVGGRAKKITPLMYILAVLFIAKYVLL